MGDRHPKSSSPMLHRALPRLPLIPGIILLSLTANGFLVGLVLLLSQQPTRLQLYPAAPAAAFSGEKPLIPPTTMGQRHQLTYRQWVDLLRQEAAIATEKQPPRLTVLLGDSLSLWFPTTLLPSERTWLNQGISGETSAGLVNRLDLLDKTRPETIFLMIGINDLLREVDDRTILQNHRRMVRYLRGTHPQTQIVLQSILPHGGENSTWEGRNRLLTLNNRRIQTLNRELKAIAQEEEVYFLDLYPLFADEKGNLRPALSTDGLHLSPQGYLVWSTALKLFSDLKLQPQP